MNFKQAFIIVFQPKDPNEFGRRRFAVSANKLPIYIGEKNAKKCLNAVKKSLKCNRITFRFRKAGRVDFYEI